jgi:hypothetical protein
VLGSPDIPPTLID